MRRLGRLCMSLTVLAAFLWSALWFWGREEISHRLDDEIARLRADGVGISVGEHSIAGFPFAYAARLEDLVYVDAATGTRTELPELTTVYGLTDPNRLVTELPSRLTVTLGVDPGMRARFPALGGQVTLEVQSEALAVITRGIAGSNQAEAITVEARRLEIGPATPLEGLDFRLEATAFTADLTLGAADWSSLGQAALRAGSLTLSHSETLLAPEPGTASEQGAADAAAAAAKPGGASLSSRLSLTDLTLAADAADTAPEALAALMDGRRSGQAALNLIAGAVSGALTVAGTGRDDGQVSLETGRFAGRIAIRGSDILTEAEATGVAAGLAPAAADDPRRGRIEATRLVLSTAAPNQAGSGMRPVRIALGAEGLAPAAELWSRLDPDGALPREPGHLRVEIDGTGRLLAPHGDTRTGAATPLEIGNLSLAKGEFAALGAQAQAWGDLEFIQPGYEPRGQLSLKLTGALSLIRRLHTAGLIDEQAVQMLATTAAIYSRGGDGPDQLLADLVFTAEGTRLNDTPID